MRTRLVVELYRRDIPTLEERRRRVELLAIGLERRARAVASVDYVPQLSVDAAAPEACCNLPLVRETAVRRASR